MRRHHYAVNAFEWVAKELAHNLLLKTSTKASEIQSLSNTSDLQRHHSAVWVKSQITFESKMVQNRCKKKKEDPLPGS